MAPKPGDRVTVTVDVEYRHDARDHLGVLYVTHEGSTYGLPNVQSIEVVVPPKPEKPTGLGAVVEDEDGDRWTLACPRADDGQEWWSARAGWSTWSDITAVRILSAGVDQ